MTRQNLGFVASRALSIFCLLAAIKELSGLALSYEVLREPFGHQDWPILIGQICAIGLTLLTAMLLWVKAAKFAGEDAGGDGEPLTVRTYAKLTLRAVGAFFMISAVIHLYLPATQLFLETKLIAHVTETSSFRSFIGCAVEFLVGLLVFAWNSGNLGPNVWGRATTWARLPDPDE